MREFLNFMKEYYGDKPLTGVEIGVFRGKHSRQILRNFNINKLYLIDPYERNEVYIKHEVSPGLKRIQQREWDNLYKYVIKLATEEGYADKCEFIRRRSDECADDIPDNMDFIYLDGDHHYPMVVKDIELYYPKVKSGGLFGGHDYEEDNNDVIIAVDEFVKKHNFKLYVNKNERTAPDWWVIKE